MITIKTGATYGKGSIKSLLIIINGDQTNVDRISLLELVSNKLSELFPSKVTCFHNSLKLISLDYRNLNTLVKISPNVLMKLRRSVLHKKQDIYDSVLTLRVNHSIINDVIYFKVESAKYAYEGAYAKPNEKWIKHDVRTRPYFDYKTLNVPTFNELKKSVNSKFIATQYQYTLDSLPGVPMSTNENIEHEFNSLVCSIQNEIKLRRSIFFNLSGSKRTVIDIGICNTINPLLVILLKGGATEHINLEDHTPHSLGILFTQEIIKHFG